MNSQRRNALTSRRALEIYQRRPGVMGFKKSPRGTMSGCMSIASEFGVTAKTVRDIWRGRTWGDVTGHPSSDAENRIRPRGLEEAIVGPAAEALGVSWMPATPQHFSLGAQTQNPSLPSCPFSSAAASSSTRSMMTAITVPPLFHSPIFRAGLLNPRLLTSTANAHRCVRATTIPVRNSSSCRHRSALVPAFADRPSAFTPFCPSHRHAGAGAGAGAVPVCLETPFRFATDEFARQIGPSPDLADRRYTALTMSKGRILPSLGGLVLAQTSDKAPESSALQVESADSNARSFPTPAETQEPGACSTVRIFCPVPLLPQPLAAAAAAPICAADLWAWSSPIPTAATTTTTTAAAVAAVTAVEATRRQRDRLRRGQPESEEDAAEEVGRQRRRRRRRQTNEPRRQTAAADPVSDARDDCRRCFGGI